MGSIAKKGSVTVLPPSGDRAQYVKRRLVEINQAASDIIIENGLLLREYMQNGYYREDGFESFNEAIEAMQNAGQIEYGPSQARNFIRVVDMFDRLQLPEEQKKLGISKLREIATVKDEKKQRKLLEAAPDMSVAEVQKAAKKIRDEQAGRDVDPLDPIIIKGASASQHEFYNSCIKAARKEYSLNEDVPEAAVLVDSILAEWHSGLKGVTE